MDKQAKKLWWNGLSAEERRVYAYPASFVDIVCENIPRYRDRYNGNAWAVRAAMKKILDGPFPIKLNEDDGRQRVALYNAMNAWATIRDLEEADEEE
jgi:hypothetical protein